jgi:putative flippase GtrA
MIGTVTELRRPRLAGQIPRFAAVGALATLVHFVTLALLVEIVRVPWPTVASAIGAVLGIATSYLGNYAWTFARREPHRAFVGQFIVTYLLTMTLHTLLMYAQTNFLKLDYTIAFVVATAASTAMNFLLSKFAVFERKGIATWAPNGIGHE